MKYTVEVHGIEDSKTTFDDDKEGLTFVKANIDWAVKNRVFTQIHIWRENGTYACGFTVNLDGTVNMI